MKRNSHMEYSIREIRKEEYNLLDDFLYEALFVPEGAVPFPREIIQQPELQVYVKNFGAEKDDICFVAEIRGAAENSGNENDSENQAGEAGETIAGLITGAEIVGAVWVRDMKDYGHIEDGIPSFAISLYKEYRGYGIGTALMKRMLKELEQRGYKKASLSVQKANYAAKMYQKLGFEVVHENEEEYIMVCTMDSVEE